MKRAYLIEMTVLGGYLRKLLVSALVCSLFVGVGMRFVGAVPALITVLLFMTAAMSAAAYDEQGGWGLFRLTLPLSRRDVVLGRYAAIFTVGCCGAVLGLAVTGAITAVATVVELPGGLSEELAFDLDTARGTIFATALCALMGSFVASVVTPVYFRFGQTRATQYLPVMLFLLFMGIGMLVDSGLLDSASFEQGLARLVALLETPAGLPCAVAVLVAASVVLLAVSAAVSLRLYEHREL